MRWIQNDFVHIQTMEKLVLTKDQIERFNSTREQSVTDHLCHAPYSSLYFNHKGDVSVCCWNHAFPIGKYGDIPLKDLWNGQSIELLRGKVDAGDLSYGCSKCFDKFNSNDFHGIMSRTYDSYSGDDQIVMPKVITFEISNTCNLECEMCWGYYSSKIRSKLDKLPAINSPYDDNFIEQLGFFLPTLQEVRFLGGEPLLIPIYLEIISSLTKLNSNIRISITTNGTIWNDKIAELLTSVNTRINVSIDSFRPEVYNRIRKGSSFTLVKQNLTKMEALHRQGKIQLGISFCPMRSNWEEIPELISTLGKNEIDLYLNSTFYPTSVSLQSLLPKHLDRIIKKYELEICDRTSDYEVSQLKGLVNQLKSWKTTNNNLFNYNINEVRSRSIEVSENKSTKVRSIIRLLVDIHWKTVNNECASESFKSNQTVLIQMLRDSEEAVSSEFLEALELLPIIFDNCISTDLGSNSKRLIDYLNNNQNSYRVLISFILRNDIIYILSTLNSELLMNMKTFSDYDN